MAHKRNLSVIGLGYVGLPVAVACGRIGTVVRFDVNSIIEWYKDHDGVA